MAPRRLALWGLVSTCLAIATVVHAFRKRPNFYAAAVYLAKSNACMMILWNQGIFQTVLLGKALQAVFLGELRLIEVERLQERGWFAVTETLLALTIFKNDFESTFVLLFVGLLFLKVFHWLASDRIEMMEQAAQVSRLAHARMLGLLSLLWLADIGCLVFAVESIMIDGPTVMIMFASEYLILLANVWTLSAKYVINCIDMRNEAPWEEKSIYVFYVELAADFFKLCTYLTFFGLILTFYGLPLNILRDVYITLRSFILKVRDLRRYRQATRNMDELYPNATREEMDGMADKTCIICREDMEWRPARGEQEAGAGGAEGAGPAEAPAPAPAAPRTGPNDTPKKLPCGHVFHFHCLRSWLERQQSCPTCRRPVLPNEQPQAAPPVGAGVRAGNGAAPAPAAAPGTNGAGPTTPAPAEAENAAIREAQVNLARNLGREAFTSLFPGIPFPPEAEDGQPAARAPRIASPEGTDVNQAAAEPRPNPTQPSIPSSPPIASTSGAANAAAADADNPLARFSLPSLPVPTGGEASLYQAPPTFTYPAVGAPTSSFADLAYGAYPRFSGTRPPAFGATSNRASPPNLIERIETVRTRWETRINGQPESAADADDGVLSGSAPGVPTGVPTGVSAEPPEARPPTAEEKGKGRAIENVEEVDAASLETVSPREAALRAAERRLGSGVTGSSTATENAVDTEAIDEKDAKEKARDAEPSAKSLSPPRLIPLFDPSDPASVRAAALRCASGPAQPAVLSHVDLESAVSEAMQGKLRQLASFQARIDRLVEEMRDALGDSP